jgi:hypothetical protein
MKASEVQIGQRYYAKVNNRVTTVRIVEQTPYMRGRSPLYLAINERTNRKLMLTPRRLRMVAE